MNKPEIVNILGLNISNVSLPEVIGLIKENLTSKKEHLTIFTPNVDFTIEVQKNKKYLNVLNSATYLVPDGMPLVWASKFFGTPLKEKVAGPILFYEICNIANKHNYSVFLLGGNEGVANKASVELKKTYSNLNIVGAYYAPIGFEYDENENLKILDRINSCSPDILIIGLGGGQGERWIHRFKSQYHAHLSIQLGSSINFAAGINTMPPIWVLQSGLGWLWRLIEEPRRLWRRYLVHGMKFFYYVFQQKFNLKDFTEV